MEEYNLWGIWPLHNFWFLSGVFPFRHGARPVSTKYIFLDEEMSTPLIFTEIEKRIQKMPIFYPKTIDINRKISLTLQV